VHIGASGVGKSVKKAASGGDGEVAMTALPTALPAALLESLRSIGYTLDTALADIIDNSITAEAERISICFLWNKGNPWIAICDDGLGMSSEELNDAMRFGSRGPRSKRDSNDLGRFGLGMKTASISQCRRLTVVSKQNNSIAASEWNLGAMIQSGAMEWSQRALSLDTLPPAEILAVLVAQQLKNPSSGTVVLWQNLDISLGDPEEANGEKRFSANMDSARKHLELVFHRFLSPAVGKKKVIVDFNGAVLEAFDPFGSSVPARQELPSETIRVQGEEILVQPYVLPHLIKAASVSEYQKLAGDDGYLHNQGFYIYRNQRLIIKATWFRLIPKDELNKLIRIRVDIPNTLDDIWRIDVKKSQANPPESVRLQLKRIITRISGAGRMVFTNRAAKLGNRKVTPVWRREVIDGKIHYRVNEGHPLVKTLLNDLPEAQGDTLRACFELLNSTFPYDMYYADAANDKTEFAHSEPTQETIKQVGIQLVIALRSCGYEGTQLREQLAGVEFFKCSPQLLEEILQIAGGSNG
jgi:hypothetical protein